MYRSVVLADPADAAPLVNGYGKRGPRARLDHPREPTVHYDLAVGDDGELTAIRRRFLGAVATHETTWDRPPPRSSGR